MRTTDKLLAGVLLLPIMVLLSIDTTFWGWVLQMILLAGVVCLNLWFYRTTKPGRRIMSNLNNQV